MKSKTLLVAVFMLLFVYPGRAQDILMNDSCITIYGTGIINAKADQVEIQFSIDEAPIGGPIDETNIVSWFPEDTTYYNTVDYTLRPCSGHVWESRKHNDSFIDSFIVEYSLITTNIEETPDVINNMLLDHCRISKISYSLRDESSWKLKAFKQAVDDAYDKIDYIDIKFSYVDWNVVAIKEISPTSIEYIESGTCIRMTSIIQIVLRLHNLNETDAEVNR